MNEPTKDPFADPRVLSAVENFAKSFASYSGRNMPYYNSAAAAWVKDIIKQLWTGRKALQISVNEGAKISTMRLKYYQGVKWIKEHKEKEDPENFYIPRLNSTRLCTYRDYIELHIKRDVEVKIAEVVPTDWKDKVLDFIQTAENGAKYHEAMTLADSECNWLEGILEPVKDLFLFDKNKWRTGEVLIIRYDPD